MAKTPSYAGMQGTEIPLAERQLSSGCMQQKIPHASTKTRHCQMNIKRKKEMISLVRFLISPHPTSSLGWGKWVSARRKIVLT